MIHVDIVSLLEFYDEKIPSSHHHATAINAIAGEDMGAGLFLHYLRQKDIVGEILPYRCTQGTKSGVRLDKWIRVTKNNKKIYYQTEIKNWSAHAFGGKRFMINSPKNIISEHKKERWNKFWDGKTLRDLNARKVLTLMKLPEEINKLSENRKIEPLICFWDSMHPEGKKEPFFPIKIKDKKFSKLWVFSMSAHLRNLLVSGEKTISIDMPDTSARIKWLKKLFHIK